MRSAATGKLLLFQYCSTIASAADPHPSFSWCTYGTSSHKPESPAVATKGKTTASAAVKTDCLAVFRDFLASRAEFVSVYRHDDQNEGHRYQQNDQQIAVIQPSRREVMVHLVLALRHAS